MSNRWPTRQGPPPGFALVCLAAAVVACGSAPEPQADERASHAAVETASRDHSDAALLDALIGNDLDAARSAVDRTVETKDQRFVAVLIELMRASQVQILHADGRGAYSAALEAITGQSFGDDWGAWITWYAESDLQPPAGFTGWKGRLLGRLDPGFVKLLPEGAATTIRVEEIVWGGVAFDGIPALDHPTFIAASDATYLEPDEPVFGISLNGDARAYPLRILDWHEMTNDVVGGVPVSLAYCTLCGAGIAYDGRASEGQTFEFGSSGLLMRSNKLMYDRQTESLWNQFTGQPVLGPLVGRGIELRKLPVVVAKWRDWQAAHPNTRVLDPDTGFERPYHQGAAYAGYFASPNLMFPVRTRSELLEPKQRVFGLEVGGVPKAYPVDVVTAAQVVNDEIDGTGLSLVATRGGISVDGKSVRSGPATYRAGAEVRAYRTRGERFAAGPDPQTVVDGGGRRWRVTEEALVGPDGERAERIAGFLSYWFGWNAFHPRTLIYGHP